MREGQTPEVGRSRGIAGRSPRPSRRMRQRAEQMAELLDQAAPANRTRRRRAASVSTAVLGLSAFAVGGVGVVLGLDPQSAQEELSLPRLHDMPSATDVLGPAGARGDDGSRPDSAEVDPTTGVSTITDAPAAAPPAIAPARTGGGAVAGSPVTATVTAPPGPPSTTTTSATPTTSRSSHPTSGHPTTSPRSGRPTTHTTPPTSRSMPGPALPRGQSRVSAPSLGSGAAPGASAPGTSSAGGTSTDGRDRTTIPPSGAAGG